MDPLFNFSYDKRKNPELFKDLEKMVNIAKIQNYIPMILKLVKRNY